MPNSIPASGLVELCWKFQSGINRFPLALNVRIESVELNPWLCSVFTNTKSSPAANSCSRLASMKQPFLVVSITAWADLGIWFKINQSLPYLTHTCLWYGEAFVLGEWKYPGNVSAQLFNRSILLVEHCDGLMGWPEGNHILSLGQTPFGILVYWYRNYKWGGGGLVKRNGLYFIILVPIVL